MRKIFLYKYIANKPTVGNVWWMTVPLGIWVWKGKIMKLKKKN